MDVSVEQDGEVWIHQAFGVPSVPKSRRDHYPFSKCTALPYRLKLAFALLNAACAFILVEDPCDRLSLLLTFWLLFITCESVYKNYPWREPLNVWLWRLRWAVPYSEVLSTICVVLLLLVWTQVGVGCELPHPLAAGVALWLCFMVAWPLVRERWHREERSEDDYDQFSAIRPWVLTLPRPFALVLAALYSPSLLAFLAMYMASSVPALFLHGWVADVWAASTGVLVLGCLAVLCCHRLPEDVRRTLAAWEVDEASYARRIENTLRIVKAPNRKALRVHLIHVHKCQEVQRFRPTSLDPGPNRVPLTENPSSVSNEPYRPFPNAPAPDSDPPITSLPCENVGHIIPPADFEDTTPDDDISRENSPDPDLPRSRPTMVADAHGRIVPFSRVVSDDPDSEASMHNSSTDSSSPVADSCPNDNCRRGLDLHILFPINDRLFCIEDGCTTTSFETNNWHSTKDSLNSDLRTKHRVQIKLSVFRCFICQSRIFQHPAEHNCLRRQIVATSRAADSFQCNMMVFRNTISCCRNDATRP
ncbi:hypothetical protein AVEN_28134-1 [Araneus ventricosus]|uniref:Transmembrane protein n=1 Tax=Araneus ventricosus TaxID=182803 RepID=A0A4Y2GD16_ARAVE|nr:hypothetical protein AVEN_28134-1 [Araneus ventricosus]